MDPTERRTQPESIRDLLRELNDGTRDLVRKEIALARVEMRDEMVQAKRGALWLSGSAGAGFIGMVLVALTLAYLFAEVMRPWLAALIPAILMFAVAGALAYLGQKELKRVNLKPEQTIDSLKEDSKWAKERLS